MILYIRGQDAWGAGHYNARRTKGEKVYKHEGIDVLPEDALGVVRAFVKGTVSKFGRPYTSGPMRYVQITTASGNRHRYFYVDPAGLVSIGDKVQKGDILGQMQGQEDKFPGITPHYHFEIIPRGRRRKIDPGPVLGALGYELIIMD